MIDFLSVIQGFLIHLSGCEIFLYFLIAFAVFSLSNIIVHYFMS